MSEVMKTNKIKICYAFDREFIARHWIETGEFIGYGDERVIECDTPEKRRLIVTIDWHGAAQFYGKPRAVNALGSPLYAMNSNVMLEGDGKSYDHVLTVDEIWAEIRLMAQAVQEQDKQFGKSTRAVSGA